MSAIVVSGSRRGRRSAAVSETGGGGGTRVSGGPSRSVTRARMKINTREDERGTLRQRMYILFDDPNSSRAAKILAVFIMLVIVVSCTSFVVETLPEYRRETEMGETNVAFVFIEVFAIAVFTLEYALRVSTVSSMPVSYLNPEAEREAELDRARAKLDGSYAARASESNLAAKQLGTLFCTANDPARGPVLCWNAPLPVAKTWDFLWSPFNLIDLVAILPFYITLMVNDGSLSSSSSFAVIRVLRLARVVRLFKLGRYSNGMRTFGRVLRRSRGALALMASFFVLSVVVFGSAIYFFEGGDYDEETGKWMRLNVKGDALEESPFSSIPRSFWWVAVTCSTVGYGDAVPTTSSGKVVAVATMFVGILVLTLPISLIGAHFQEEYESQREEEEVLKMVEDLEHPPPAAAAAVAAWGVQVTKAGAAGKPPSRRRSSTRDRLAVQMALLPGVSAADHAVSGRTARAELRRMIEQMRATLAQAETLLERCLDEEFDGHGDDVGFGTLAGPSSASGSPRSPGLEAFSEMAARRK